MGRKRGSNRSKVRERAATKQSGGGFSVLQLPEGIELLPIEKAKKGDKTVTQYLDFFPYEVKVDNHPQADKGEDWYERTFFVHRDIGAEEKPYICPKKTFKKPCAICDERQRLMDDDYDANEDRIKALRPSERQLFNVMDTESGKMYVLDMSSYCFGEHLEKELNEGKEELGSFDNLEGGYTLKVRWSEAQIQKTKYWECDRIDFEKRGDYGEDIFDFVADLDACLIVTESDDLERIFLELDDSSPTPDDGDPGAGDEDNTGPSRPSGPARPGRKAPADKEEKEPVKPKPAGRGRGTAAKPKEERQRPVRQPAKEEAPAKEKAPAGDEQCPHDGVFGDDCDKLDACFECTDWNACKDRQEGVA